MHPPLSSSDLEKYLKDQGIHGEVLHLTVLTPTVEAAADALGVPCDAIVKSLLFLVEGKPVLAVASGTARVDNRLIAAEFGVGRKRVRLASPEVVLEIAGYIVGAMPPFGHRQKLMTLIDPSVLEHEAVYAGGGDDNAMMRIRPVDLKNAAEGKMVTLQEDNRSKREDESTVAVQ
jgi:prolyl-tRNA editing enzyme YbaK/EbsC (Cys-tRNA(Pro) deacylase)